MVYVILRFIAAPTREIGDFMVKAPDHASYAYLPTLGDGGSEYGVDCRRKPLEHPNRLSGLQVRPPALFRLAHFWIIIMQPFENYSTRLARGADMRRTGGPRHSMPVSID